MTKKISICILKASYTKIILRAFIIVNVISSTLMVNLSHAEDWQYEITPYLWTAGIDGDIGSPRRPVNVDVSFSDYIDLVDLGAAFAFEAKNDKWTVTTDVLWLKLSKDLSGPRNTIDIENEQLIFEGQIGYKPFDWKNTSVIGGLRYMNTETKIKFERLPDVDISDNFIDPYIGLLWRSYVRDNIEVGLQLDVGGGIDADLVIGGIAGVAYDINDKYRVRAGYRFLDVDFESDDLVFDAVLQGISVGLGIKF